MYQSKINEITFEMRSGNYVHDYIFCYLFFIQLLYHVSYKYMNFFVLFSLITEILQQQQGHSSDVPFAKIPTWTWKPVAAVSTAAEWRVLGAVPPSHNPMERYGSLSPLYDTI